MMTENIEKNKNLYKTLGKKSARLITLLTQKKQPVFSIKEAANILEASSYEIRKLLSQLVERGWLQRLEKGKYLVVPLSVDSSQPYTENQLLIASKLASSPHYIGFWTMLNHYGYTEQFGNTIFVASAQRKKEVVIAGVKYKFIKLSPKKFFGISDIEMDGVKVQVSDKEKTILDCLDHLEYCGGIFEAAKGIWKARDDIDYGKLLDYALKMQNSAAVKRLGFLLEVFDLEKRVNIETLRKNITKGFSPLDPLLPRHGIYVSRWNLLVNVLREELFSLKRV